MGEESKDDEKVGREGERVEVAGEWRRDRQASRKTARQQGGGGGAE